MTRPLSLQAGAGHRTEKEPYMSEPTKKAKGKVLVLRTCNADRTSRDGFQWPEVGGTATAPDWDPDPDRACGGGLHGLLWGCGEAGLLSGDSTALWQVVSVKVKDIANPDAPDKVRFRTGKVVFEGDRDGATSYLLANGAAGRPVVYAHATAGRFGTATAGDYGTATAGYYGTATAGRYGTIVIKWWDYNATRYRLTVGYPGEDGIEPNVAYRCDEAGNLVRADGAA